MAVHEHSHRSPAPHQPSAAGPAARAGTRPGRTHALALLRLVTGFVFLWAFLDKTFGLGYATPSGRGWIDGGSPTKGFLGSVAAGPMRSTFHSWAGAAWVDVLFMLGMLGIGLALVAGVALRLTAVAGTVMMVLMWAAEWPPARTLADGTPSMSTNPFADYHVVYALVLVVLAACSAGDTLGLGRLWSGLPFVRRGPWLR
ncbi:integral membrane protein SCJ12.13c [Streptomyces zinciresistens K42]|uniref:Integral membrane protein SCJ12.13c n=1 Tax=Streptomyces zinciresistens K42 TaxID=700597 RepID=G2GNW0_9ACTN|nr:DoxX family membrane protein [Streptomyces zinciresistens]EGX54803.1 integral membrane protein SCJ12.13c [Streptomyces zinciresistens K42]